MAVALASPPRTPREWLTDPVDPPRRSRSTPDVLPLPIRAGWAATADLDRAGRVDSPWAYNIMAYFRFIRSHYLADFSDRLLAGFLCIFGLQLGFSPCFRYRV